MKHLLRQGWIRAGVPVSSIESLADHSWAVAVLAYIFAITENSLHTQSEPVDVNKATLIALFHDFHESEFLDIDKSLENIVGKTKADEIKVDINNGAVRNLLEKFPIEYKCEFKKLITDDGSIEYKIARIADITDLLIQTYDYNARFLLNQFEVNSFEGVAYSQLSKYESEFSFIVQLKIDLKALKN
ncbi:MAG: HD domain-containing protein [Candidatus Heimdallarchaeota archaeon]|nr:HD domain-containing protein [Candidatus Heimdallarchaeota archaeon]